MCCMNPLHSVFNSMINYHFGKQPSATHMIRLSLFIEVSAHSLNPSYIVYRYIGGYIIPSIKIIHVCIAV